MAERWVASRQNGMPLFDNGTGLFIAECVDVTRAKIALRKTGEEDERAIWVSWNQHHLNMEAWPAMFSGFDKGRYDSIIV